MGGFICLRENGNKFKNKRGANRFLRALSEGATGWIEKLGG